MSDSFGNIIYSGFIDILRSVGIMPTVLQLDVLRQNCEKMGNKLENAVSLKTLEKVDALKEKIEKVLDRDSRESL